MRNGAQNLIGLALTEDEQDFGVKITKHAYPEKVVVRNGFVYYAYKPNYDANLNKLYRQKLWSNEFFNYDSSSSSSSLGRIWCLYFV